MKKCKKHPKYKAIRRPRVPCEQCAEMYQKSKSLWYFIFVKDKPKVGKNLRVRGIEFCDIVLDYFPTIVIGCDGKATKGYAVATKSGELI